LDTRNAAIVDEKRGMELLEAITTRRTIGKSAGEVSRETIVELIDAAVWAPNHKMTQPWRYTVVTGHARAELGRVWAESAAAGVPADQRDAFVAGEAKKPLRAPVLIIASLRTDADPIVADEDFAATAAGVQNLLLAAHAKGLAAGWKSGKICYNADVKRFLGLDETDRIIAIVYLGAVANEEPPVKPRDVERAIRWIGEPVPA
jgi:nitroreductase